MQIPTLDMPLHTLIELTPMPDGTMKEERFPVDIDMAVPGHIATAASSAAPAHPPAAHCTHEQQQQQVAVAPAAMDAVPACSGDSADSGPEAVAGAQQEVLGPKHRRGASVSSADSPMEPASMTAAGAAVVMATAEVHAS